ncbi:hypothetical protein SAMN05216389_11321 [Oceanobacillus limi]|uniref:Rhodanese domain-containing protein n=1 Tax=Oceanobacillus limi TaxID=930131 RepID=A0A1I0EYS5_9BACI|nr:DUF402 domain-containing protein [Oceanobacillus limi]SET50507.1 hypothetical protein SAMN05216389_11321 [Oceanobacillus limi]
MLKRKYTDHKDWSRIIQRDYVQTHMDTKAYKGYVSLLTMHSVTHPLTFCYGKKNVCIVDNGYSWLQHFPEEKYYSITTAFDEEGEIVQWYIDIIRESGIEDDRLWFDDLYLDIVVLPTGEVILLDEEELEEAYKKGVINDRLYQLAWREARSLMKIIKEGNFALLELTKKHRMELLQM